MRLGLPFLAVLALAGAGCNSLLDNSGYMLVDDASVDVNPGPAQDAGSSEAAAARDAEVADVVGADAAPCVLPTGSCTPGECQKQGIYICLDGGVTCSATGSVQDGTPCGPDGGNGVCVSGTCGTCVAGSDCSTPHGCTTMTNDCSTGTAVCTFQANVANGTPCGADAGFVCNGGSCVACNAGGDCSASGSCQKQTYDCSSGTAVCTDAGLQPDNTSCGTGMYCYGGVCSACTINAACTPANACDLGTVSSCAGGVATCSDSSKPVTNGTSCGTNEVCNAGSCVACTAGVSCTPANPCHTGTVSCSTGSAVCVDTGGNVPNGNTCGTNEVCDNGSCFACTAGQSCTPANTCHSGSTSCATGQSACVDTGTNVANGTSCAMNEVCLSGTCTECVTGDTCTPANPCDVGTTSCSTGTSTCTDTGTPVAAGTSCGSELECESGSCTACPTWYPDCDEDGEGTLTGSVVSCTEPAGIPAFCSETLGLTGGQWVQGVTTANADCCDIDPNANHSQTSFFGTADKCGPGAAIQQATPGPFDYNCDGVLESPTVFGACAFQADGTCPSTAWGGPETDFPCGSIPSSGLQYCGPSPGSGTGCVAESGTGDVTVTCH